MIAATLKAVLKSIAFASGALPLWHRQANADRLTVVMFHRVLRREDPRWRLADPGYTVSDVTFRACLDFFRRHYSVVDSAAVLAAAQGGPPLPPRPLLITLDDGWADNASAALPILREAGLPSLMFAVSEGIGRPHPFWWEVLTSARLIGRLGAADMAALWQGAGGGGPPPPPDARGIQALVDRLYRVDEAARAALIEPYRQAVAAAGEQRQTVTAEELKAMPAGGMAIGSHGASHTPLDSLPDPEADLALSRRTLGDWLGEPPATFSFPNGRYDAKALSAARDVGFKLIFTSDACLSPLTAGRPGSDLLGRIYIEEKLITDAAGRFRPELLALWLFRREARRLH
ncbi:polysaccharide deacetylase family protein [Desertibaculum subflavum]|uniref:polysaccharide deacetylase family protein n=1 Tax=Desertibaculum subflavum TaxID=2268458 RepID=UPI000E6711C1